LGSDGGRTGAMTESSRFDEQALPISTVPASLAEYADRLLRSTGLHVEDALLIARGELEPAPELEQLARALRTGWDTASSA
jgi:hypothetical protein